MALNMSKSNLPKKELAWSIDVRELDTSVTVGNGRGSGGGDSIDPGDFIAGPGFLEGGIPDVYLKGGGGGDSGGTADGSLDIADSIQIPEGMKRIEEIGTRELVSKPGGVDVTKHETNEPWVTYEYLYIQGKDANNNSEIVLGRSKGDPGDNITKTTYARYKTGDSCDDTFERGNDCPIYLKYDAYCVPTHLSTGTKITEYTLFAKGKWWVIPKYSDEFIGERYKPVGCKGSMSLHAHCCGNEPVGKTTCSQAEPESVSVPTDPLIKMQRSLFIQKVREAATRLGLDVDFTNFSLGSPVIQLNGFDEVRITRTGNFEVNAVLKLDTTDSNYICKLNETSTIGLRFYLRADSFTGPNYKAGSVTEDAHSCMAIELCSEIDNKFRTQVCSAPGEDYMDNMINCITDDNGNKFCPNLSDFVGKTGAQTTGFRQNWFRCPHDVSDYVSKKVYFTVDGVETSSSTF